MWSKIVEKRAVIDLVLSILAALVFLSGSIFSFNEHGLNGYFWFIGLFANAIFAVYFVKYVIWRINAKKSK